MNSNIALPYYAKLSLVIIGLFVFVMILYIAKDLLTPLIYASMIAITLSPLVGFFVRKKMNRILAITISLFFVSVVLAALIILLSTQLSDFTDVFPKLVDKFTEKLNDLVLWTSKYINISTYKINIYITKFKNGILDNSQGAIGLTIGTISKSLAKMLLIPVCVFMILFYQPMLLDFIRKLFGKSNLKDVNNVLSMTKGVIQHYLIGLLLETTIVAILNTIGLLIIGFKYAIVLGIIGALLNLIPYIGGLIAIGLYVIIALVTKDSISSVFYVIAIYSVIQFLDNNLIVPKLVGSKVKINALVAIVGVIVGGALWGINGMFLSIPIIAILKVIFDHIESLKPWGFLLGDSMPEIISLKINMKKKKVK